jgi:hypothetical protein
MRFDARKDEDQATVRDCEYPWTWYLVGRTGHVRCCCLGSVPVGDIQSSTPESIWNNLTMQSLRASLSAGVVHTHCHGAPCQYVQGSMATEALPADDADVSPDALTGFDEVWYVQNYYDVAYGIKAGRWGSGLEHYCRYGHREFRHTSAKQAKRMVPTESTSLAAEVEPEYVAILRWLGPVHLAADTITVDFEVENAGSAPWPTALGDAADVLIRAGARLYRDLNEVSRVAAAHEYRLELPGTLHPGDSAGFTLHLDREVVPLGCSFLLIDMVWEHRFWFSEDSTVPLVLGMNREGGVDDLELVMSEPPITHDSTAGSRVDSSQKALRGWQRVCHTLLTRHTLMEKWSMLPSAVKRWRKGFRFGGRAWVRREL